MTAEATAEPAAERRASRTPRQEDGVIYKVMAFMVFFIFALPLGYGVARGLPPAVRLSLLPAGVFVFDLGWELALLAAGRRDLLVTLTPSQRLGRALGLAVNVGLFLLFFELRGDLRIVAVGLFLAHAVSKDLASGRWPGWPVLRRRPGAAKR